MFRVQLQALIVAVLILVRVHARAVYAHYLVGTITLDHAAQDIVQAQAMGLDGFALNVGDATQPFVKTTLGYLFRYAEGVGFKLFLSMDVYAAGNACHGGSKSCNGQYDYTWILDAYVKSKAYALSEDGRPLVSTFSPGPWDHTNWEQWRANLKAHLGQQIFFIPDFDATTGYYDDNNYWWQYWLPVLDGIFSWEAAWPDRGGFGGQYPGDVSADVKVFAGAKERDVAYMMGLSTLQYKNAYGANVYRAGDDNLPVRMDNILGMDPLPDFVQVMTWNDGPEAHYIGNVWPESNTDVQPNTYMGANWPHKAWQPLITAFIAAYKSGTRTTKPPQQEVVGAMWYKTILQSAHCPLDNGGIGNASFYDPPDGFGSGTDSINWAIVLPDGVNDWKVRTTSGGVIIDTATHMAPGTLWGSFGKMLAGSQKVEIVDLGGTVIYSASGGRCVSSGCPDGIYNMNYQVVPFVAGSRTTQCFDPSTPTGPDHASVSVATTDSGNFHTGDWVITLPVDLGSSIQDVLANTAQCAHVYKRGDVYKRFADLACVVEVTIAMLERVLGGSGLLGSAIISPESPVPSLTAALDSSLKFAITGGKAYQDGLSDKTYTNLATTLFVINFEELVNGQNAYTESPTQFVLSADDIAFFPACKDVYPCPPDISRPCCVNCGGNNGNDACAGIKSKCGLAWQGCPCFEIQDLSNHPFDTVQAFLNAQNTLAHLPQRPPGPPPVPSVGDIQCNPMSYVDGCTIQDVVQDTVYWLADHMDFGPVPFTPSSKNYTRVFKTGGVGGTGVAYLEGFGWIPGCDTFATQRPDRPIDPNVEFNWQDLLKNCYKNCTGNLGMGGYVDVGCIRYGTFPNDVDGIMGADGGPPAPSLFWDRMHYC